jgi:hypothetical protein
MRYPYTPLLPKEGKTGFLLALLKYPQKNGKNHSSGFGYKRAPSERSGIFSCGITHKLTERMAKTVV